MRIKSIIIESLETAFGMKESESASNEKSLKFNWAQFSIVLLVIAMVPMVTWAQTGIIRGEVKDAENGEALIGANVVVQGSSIGASTDIDGRYIVRGVPAGPQTILFRYLGFESKEVEVTVEEGETLE
jgi:hypothetical protein